MTRPELDAEHGFTLVELLTAMTLSVIIAFATLTVFDRFNSGATQQTRIAEAGHSARATMDHVVQDLRQAATITKAEPNALWYSVAEPCGATRNERVWLAGDGTLHGGSSTTVTTSGSGCPTASALTDVKIASMQSGNSGTDPLFTYDNTDLTKIKAVGLTFRLDASGGGYSSTTTLRASAVVRRTAALLAIPSEAVKRVCLQSGAQLQLDVTGLALLSPLSVTYAGNGGVALGSGLGVITVPPGITTVVATITDAAGVTRTIQKDLDCEPTTTAAPGTT